MSVEESANRFAKKQDFIHIIILLAVALGIGSYLIITTTLIAKDGVSYINYAKALAIAPFEIIRDCSGYAPSHYTPGYPFLILMAHKLVGLFGDGSTVSSWIYSAQAVVLLCRILALIPLYFIGKEFVGSKLSFWAILILVMLPYPARFGSDALREWPHMLFLSTGFLFLLWAARYRKRLMFALVGVVAGLGYTIRPICAQLVVYGVLWLVYSMFRQQRNCKMGRVKLVGGLALLVIGFAVVVAPYMKIRGEIIPDRLHQIMKHFSFYPKGNDIHKQNTSDYVAGLVPRDIAKAAGKLISQISENLMHFFVPALFIGMYHYFRRKSKGEPAFFITAFISLNIVVLMLRYCCTGLVLSRRYVLPLTAFTVFFVPVGLQIMSRWIDEIISRTVHKTPGSEEGRQRLFFIILVIGLIVCLPKLVRPLRVEKRTYRLAAEWLKNNTNQEEVIAVFDSRISFYAERRGKAIHQGRLPVNVKYIVNTTKDQREKPEKMTEVWSSYLNEKEKNDKVVIYRRK
jgi:4-amino-4-deoxy-L-arabinose transferase-like glycosyltransferase